MTQLKHCLLSELADNRLRTVTSGAILVHADLKVHKAGEVLLVCVQYRVGLFVGPVKVDVVLHIHFTRHLLYSCEPIQRLVLFSSLFRLLALVDWLEGVDHVICVPRHERLLEDA